MQNPNLNTIETTPSTPMKVYCDATREDTDGYTACGWVLTDHNGKSLDVHGTNLGKSYQIVQAEQEAITRILEVLEWDHPDVQHIKLYSDCRPAIQKLGDMDLSNGRFESVTLDWIPREQNSMADIVADVWINSVGGRNVYQQNPYGVCD